MSSFKGLLSSALLVFSIPMASQAGQELSGTYQVTRVLSIQDDAHASCIEHLPAWGCKAWYRSSYVFLNQGGKEVVARVRDCRDRGAGDILHGRHQLGLELSTGSDANTFIGSLDEAVTYYQTAGSSDECMATQARLLSVTAEQPMQIQIQTRGDVRSFQIGN